MGTEDSTTPQTIDATLSKFDVAALRRDFERLSVDDLIVLGSFPGEPHELIGRVVNATHCLLLSLAPEHKTLELRAPPWSLLRLQLLDNTTKIWRKLRKRAWQLETGVKSLSPIQIRFGCKELVPFILPLKHENHCHHGSWQLERLAQVSTIAASLGAWVVFCLCCSVSPSPSMSIHHEILVPDFHDQCISVRFPASLKNLRKRDQSKMAIRSSPSKEKKLTVLKLEPISLHNRCIRASRRIGIKIGGRFLLFHTRFVVYSTSRLDVDPARKLGEWSVYCLETHRIGHLQKSLTPTDSYPLNGSWWKPFHTIESHCSIANSLALCQMTPLALLSFLIQLGFHTRIFERPVQDIPDARTPPYLPPMFTLKLDAVVADLHSQFSLLGIGNVWITMETTVANLRTQLTHSIVSLLFGNVDRQVVFQFIYRGSILAVSQERHLAAVALMPFTMVVVTPDKCQVNEYRTGNRPSQLWRHHNGISESLVNAGLPDHMPHTQSLHAPGSSIVSPKTPQIFAVRQPFSFDTSTSSIVESFTQWRAFVYFQQLQDSSVLFQLPQRSPKKQTKSPRKSSTRRRNNDQEDGRDESVPYGPQPQLLPRKKFKSTKEWLMPLYAVIDVESPTTATLKTPFRLDVEQALCSPCRLALAEEVNVIHFTGINCVTTECDNNGVQLAMFDITFLRDENCPLDALINLKGAYVWLIVPREPHNNREIPIMPTEWMIDLYRFVQHPVFDFQSSNQQMNHFRVCVSLALAERTIEAAFWSRDVDWAPSVSSTDLYFAILHQIFGMLCRSHPPALGVDSVKFSKLLYEANIQPKLLSIGDAAFLFASNLTPGLYEMDFDGFIRAIEWIAQHFYSEDCAKDKTSPSKTRPGIQHGMMKWQLSRHGGHNPGDRLLSSLRRFCYETLVHLPSLVSTWHEIMNSWRLERKQQLMQENALKYCAATRLRATWIGFVTWRIFLQRRQRMREERQAATKLQSLLRGRWQYLEYQRVRLIVIRTQHRIHARSELRRLRAMRAAFVEYMRLRLVKWMRHHLWLLHMWKRVNAKLVARRDRIREKRLRRLSVGVFPLETRRVRFSLYRAKPIPPRTTEASATTNSSGESLSNSSDERQGSSDNAFELEVVDPIQSWGQVICISHQQVNQFVTEEADRQKSQLLLGLTTTDKKASNSVTTTMVQNQLLHESKQVKGITERDSVVYPRLKPNLMLLALARRLFILTDVQQYPQGLRCYSDPTETSLGKLVFKGALRSQCVLDNAHGELFVQRHIVRVLEWAGTFKLLIYTPATSARRRYDLDAQFILAVLQFSRFQSMRLIIHEDDNAIDADREEQAKISGVGFPADGLQQFIPYQIHRILNGAHKLHALQCIISYVLHHGMRTPTYSMMPHVIAERERQRQERESKQRNAILNRERQLIVMVQARVRQHIARNTRLQLALEAYSKQFNQEHGQFIYVLQYPSGERIVLDEQKPFSLFDQDVPLPPDEWQFVSAVDNNSRFFNPRRGVYSQFNDILAATIVQRWYREKMWDGINNWKLSDIAHAQRYYSNVQKPTKMSDPRQLENLKRYALQLHVLQYQYKAAYPIYEAALKISPDDPQTLVCLATLLIISCRYPVAQSWQRALAYLQQARELVGDEISTTLQEVEQNGFRWAMFLQPKNPHAIANYAVYRQCVYLDIDKAELFYRRALDLDPANDLFVTNFQRLQSERAPGRVYAFFGPGSITLARSSEVRRCGQWREMEDPSAQPPIPKRFYHDLRTGKCVWELPAEYLSLFADPSEISPRTTDTNC